jgi:hypothetical protein
METEMQRSKGIARTIQLSDVEELILVRSLNYSDKSAVEAGKQAAFIVVVALGLTLPLQSQQSAIGDSTDVSGSVSLAATAVSKRTQQVDQDPTVVKKPIDQPGTESLIDPSAIALDDGSPAAPPSSPETPDPQQTAPAPNGQTPALDSGHTLTGNFSHRLAQFYGQDWAGTNPAGPSVTKRGLPAPIDSPPFPFSDWTYGGAPDIGAPDGNTYPLMSALKLDNSRTKVYGWVAGSFNFSTSDQNNFPVSYDIFPNKIELNQAVVYIERLPDTVQTSHFEWGYHVTGFFGIDYRFTTAKGYFSEQLLASNKQYGFDPVLEYVDLYFPVKDGLNIRIGRFLSVPGIEAQLAPNNYNMTHSLLYHRSLHRHGSDRQP